MKLRCSAWVILGLSAVLTSGTFAAEKTKAPTTAPTVLEAKDKAGLDASTDKTVTVKGVVSEAQWATSGKVFIIKFKDTEESQFSAVLFSKNKEPFEKTFEGDLSTVFEGATIEVTGPVKMFKEHPEIVIDRAKQIKILEKAPAAATTQNTKKDDDAR